MNLLNAIKYDIIVEIIKQGAIFNNKEEKNNDDSGVL